MGQPIDQEFFDPEDYPKFKAKLHQELDQLRDVLATGTFGQQKPKLGAEVEFSLVDSDHKPAFINKKIVDQLGDHHCQFELNQFNLEYNFEPVDFEGSPFKKLEQEMLLVYNKLSRVCQQLKSQLVMTGILPTLSAEHLQESAMTDLPRYRALSRGIKELKQAPFTINIDGQEPLFLQTPDLTFEGANTSLQIHLQVKPQDFANWYNAIQLATPLAVAVAGNSPIVLHQLLWEESRIAVFKQAVDSRRDQKNMNWRQANRVNFGYGWLRRDAHEFFAELVSLYEPLLPIFAEANPKQYPPDLYELRLHQGTIWKWNRGIYDPRGEGHLRIEMRCFPSGPSLKDMIANSAFLLGLASGFFTNINALLNVFPFMFAEYNFYRASQMGLEATLLWPDLEKTSPQEISAHALARSLIPLAHEGLARVGIDQSEIESWLGIIEHRIETKQTGAVWQRHALNQLDRRFKRPQACQAMLESYLTHMNSHAPVSTWSLL